MKDYVRAGVIVGSVIFFAVLFAGCDAIAAPAPVTKTPRTRGKPPAPPLSCTMYFNEVAYDTTFAPGGDYKATCRAFPTVWEGSWNLAKTEAGYVMVIHERNVGSDMAWLTFTIPLTPDLRRGRDDWEGRFRLEG